MRDRRGRIGRRPDTALILSGPALAAFEDWLSASGYAHRPGTPIFLPFRYDRGERAVVLDRGRAGKDRPLTVRTVESVIASAAESAGIRAGDGTLSPHALRHSALTLLAKAGVDLIDLKNLAGHQDVSTTMIYLHSGR